jgi:hypothetical protein
MAKTRDIGEKILLKLSVEGEGWGGRIKQQIKSWGAAGMSEADIIAKLEKDLAPGGATFESMMNGFRNVTGEAVDYVSIEEVHDNWAGSDRWMWITVNDDNRCEDCGDRHGMVKTWEEWEALGMPGMGTTVCGWRCRCALEPREYAEEIGLNEYTGGT